MIMHLPKLSQSLWLFGFILLSVVLVNGANPNITVSPSVLTQSRQNVTVSWVNLPDPTPTDLITVHSPANQSDYIGYVYLSNTTWQGGEGQYTLPLVNNRNDYGFRLWSNATGTLTVVAESNIVTFENPSEPLQGHLMLTSNPSEMRLMWVSGSQNGSQVMYGLKSGQLDYVTKIANTTTYTVQELCDAPANLSENWRAPGWIHNAIMTGLEANTEYFYKFGSEEDGWSEEYSFISSPGVGADIPLDFFIYGDMGVSFPFYIHQDQQPPAAQTVHWVRKFLKTELENKPSLVVHIGDISYARGLAFIWDWFFEEIEPIATRVPYMVTIGNHEYDYPQQPFRPSWSNYNTDSGGECGTPYYSRFHMPGPEYTSLLNYSNVTPRNLWYSFEMGPVHFTFVSTEDDFLEGSEQYNWIAQDLASVDRSKTPWLVFSGHRPMYTSSLHTSDIGISTHLQETYEPLFQKYGVDICFWGHVHTYERTCPMYNQTCVGAGEKAPVHIIVGNAGNIYQDPWIATPPNSNYHLQPTWDMFRTENYGFGRVSANATHFQFHLIGDNRGQIHDHLVLTK